MESAHRFSFASHLQIAHELSLKVYKVKAYLLIYYQITTVFPISYSLHIIQPLILPYLQYCSIIWASTYSSHLQPLFRLQKKALRIITHSPPRAHTYSLFNKFKILNIFNIYKYQVSCFVFLHMQKLLPSPLSSLFVLNSDCHQYLTRQKDNLHLHTHKYSFSLRVQGRARH